MIISGRCVLRFSVIFAITIAASSILGGCCCPVDRQVVHSPAVDVRVVDEETGEPIEGARVTLCRIRVGPPPDALLDQWEKTTDARGRASFEYRQTAETIMPLMMHGVPQRSWELCVQHDEARGSSSLLVEKGSAQETPHEVSEQTIEVAPPDREQLPCVCERLRDESDGAGSSPE